MTEPKKFDDGKPRYDLLPPKALGLLVDCLTYGAKKYDDYNWRKDGGIDPNRLFAATQRHLWAWKEGEVLDKESGLPHLAHAATNLLMMLDLASRPPVKIPNFSHMVYAKVAAPAPELRPIQGWPYQEIEKAMKQVGGSKKKETSDGPMVVYPLDESTIKSTYAQLHAHRHDPKHFWAYDIVSDPEDVRYFLSDDGAGAELERLGVFTKVSAFTSVEGKEKWTYSRTALGHAVQEYIHKIDAKVEPEPLTLSGNESEAYYWISRCSPESRAYKAVVDPNDWVSLDNTEDNLKFAESLSAMFEKTSTARASTITLYRTPSGHKIRSLLNAKS